MSVFDILCLGDSITDCNHLFSDSSLGDGYVRMLSERFACDANEHSVSITNRGVDGFTTAMLLERADRYAAMHADLITLLIGINDVGVMMNTNRTDAERQMLLDRFSDQYRRILNTLTGSGASVILMEPFLFPHPDELHTWLPYVSDISKRADTLAKEYRLPYVALHDLLNQKAAQYGYDALTTDGIHLTEIGHQIVADLLYPVICNQLMNLQPYL